MEFDDMLGRIERAGQMNRRANEELLDGHLAGAAVVVSQQAAMRAQGVLDPSFPVVEGVAANVDGTT